MSGKHFALGMVASIVAGLTAPPTARAAVSSAGPGGFGIKSSVVVAGAPADVYARFLEIERWWNPKHSYSGKGENMSLRAQAGGCFCETLPGGGSVEHGGQCSWRPATPCGCRAASGRCSPWLPRDRCHQLRSRSAAHTRVTLAYAVAGYLPGKGLGELAMPVDAVLSGNCCSDSKNTPRPRSLSASH